MSSADSRSWAIVTSRQNKRANAKIFENGGGVAVCVTTSSLFFLVREA